MVFLLGEQSKKINKVTKNENLLYQELVSKIKKYITKKDILDQINQAYVLAKQKHIGQKRITGEEFIIHPIMVAQTLSDLQSEPNTLIAGLLHDVLEDTDLTFDELKIFFGTDVAYIVERITKLTKIVFNQNQRQIENQQKMFLAMAHDIRVVLVKIADRLHNMQTLKEMQKDKQIRIADETLAIYVPLTHRLGLFKIKSQLEDLSFRYTNPQEYYRIAKLIQRKKNEREKSINKIIENIQNLFEQSSITNFQISGRSKSIYSIYKKMKQRKVSFEEIFDLLAVRIIVDKVDLCYRCLGIIHNYYSPLPFRFKDYIAVPKINLYQSLHNTVLAKDGTLFEIQIRTKEMDEIAEKGIAAHWCYKENKIYSKQNKQLEISRKLRWYKELIQITQDSENHSLQNSKEFVDMIKNDILSESVYVFTPEQEVFEFPKGSTPIDFAFRIHTMIGCQMIGAIVNGKIVSLDYKLKNGDIISIKTSKNIFRVNQEWLKIVKTSYAKKIIKKILYKKQQEKTIFAQLGKELLEKELKNHHIEWIIDQNFITHQINKQDIKNLNELYEAIGNKKINCTHIITKIKAFHRQKDSTINSHFFHNIKNSSINEIGVYIEGLNKTKLKLANCCQPVFDEEIVGFISRNRGVNIHTKNCPNLKKYDVQQIIKEAYWYPNTKIKYVSWLVIFANYTASLLSDVTQTTNNLNISILKLNTMNNNKLFKTTIKLQILVNNIQILKKLIENLSKLPDIYQIFRGNN